MTWVSGEKKKKETFECGMDCVAISMRGMKKTEKRKQERMSETGGGVKRAAERRRTHSPSAEPSVCKTSDVK